MEITEDLTMPTEQQRKEFIRQTFEQVSEGYGQGALRFFHDSGKFMAQLQNLTGNERVLDVACGTGAACIPLAQQLPKGRVTAVDFSPKMIDQARHHAQRANLSNIEFEMHDMAQLPYADGQFDHANCAFGLFFIEDMAALLNHIGSKVKPGGQVIISGFYGESFLPMANLIIERLRSYDVEIPEQTFGWQRMAEPEQLQELFESAGLEQLQITRKSFGYYITPAEWWDCVWFAGFRGLVSQVGSDLPRFKQEHFEELEALTKDGRLWLTIDVNFARGIKPQ